MNWRGKARVAARLWCATGAGARATRAAPPVAQPAPPADPAELDPSAPLDPMPDLGVDWPDTGPTTRPRRRQPPARPRRPTSRTAGTRPRRSATANRRAPPPNSVTALRSKALRPSAPTAELIAAFDQQSALHKNRNEAANAAQIDRRSRADAELLAELLRSQGYYDARSSRGSSGRRAHCWSCFDAEPGAQYRFQSVELPGLDAAGAEAARLREAFAVKAGDPVIAEKVIAAGIALKVALGEQGFALAKVGEQDIVIDHEAHTAQLVLPVDAGPGRRVRRDQGQRPAAVQRRASRQIARFNPGDPFERSKVDDLRRALIATGLVASVEVSVVPADDGRTVDLAVKLEPAPMRTIAGELGYGTGEGVRAEASWQHRNFFNPEGALTVRGVAGTQEQLAAVQFRRSNFRARDQVLNLQALASHVDRDAYRSQDHPAVGGKIERQSNIIWHKKWTWSLGADLHRHRRTRDVRRRWGSKATETFLIAALPASLGYDGSDDLLDPTRGFRLGGRISPEISRPRRQLRLCPGPDRRQRLSSGVATRGRRRPHPAGDDHRRQRADDRPVAAVLFGRRRVGARLWLSAARAARRRRRSDRRPRPGRIRPRSARPAEGVRRQFRHRAVHRRRHAVDRSRGRA